ncbi:MAG: ATP synthase F1 subunit gamma [Bacteroidota bacterium]|nr:ATP synthase F1 subunit gamma [bacterium]NBP63590.1 ATP synthase F1 subunit gamma [Bacteroidota bacterium]
MATLRDIRNRITAVKSTAKITSAMRMVAAAKLRRAQEAILSTRPYTEKFTEVLSNLAGSSSEDYYHPLLRKPDTFKHIVVIVISSDRGLCGSFNTNVLRMASQYIDQTIPSEFPHAKVSVISVGRRSSQFFAKRTQPVLATFPDIFGQLQFNTAAEIASIAANGFINEEFDRVMIFNNEFKSIIKQETTFKQLLPVESVKSEQSITHDYIFEPSRGDIMDAILPKFVNTLVWKGLLESNAAEQAARMMAMESATTNARDLIRSLQLSYNKARQASITTEMLEIVGGAEALKA